MKTLIVGGTGMIGYHAANLLASARGEGGSHPLIGDLIVPTGTIITFDPAPAAEELRYRLNDVCAAIKYAVAEFEAGAAQPLLDQRWSTGRVGR